MAMLKGALALAAIKKGATWNTPVAADSGVAYRPAETFKSQVELIPDEAVYGFAQQFVGDAGPRMFSGELPVPVRYEGHEWIPVAMIMGTAGAPTTVDTSAKKHVLKIANSVDGLFTTLAIDKGVKVHEFKSVKWTGFKIACSRTKAELTLRGTASDLDEASATNTTGTIAAATLPANKAFLLFKQMVVRANAQSGGALGSSDVLHVESIEIDVERNLKTDEITTELGDKVSEPTNLGWVVTSVTLGFSKAKDGTGGNAAFRSNVESKTAQKMDITFTGATLAGAATQFFQAIFYLNGVQLKEGMYNAAAAGVAGYSITAEAHKVSASPTGFPSGYTDEVTIEVYNQRATDLLA